MALNYKTTGVEQNIDARKVDSTNLSGILKILLRRNV